MPYNCKTDVFLKKLYYIHEQCASSQKERQDQLFSQDVDEFAQLRCNIANEIRQTRYTIEQREQDLKEGISEVAIIKGSSNVRQKIKSIVQNVETLEALSKKDEDNLRSFKDQDSDKFKLLSEKVEENQQVINYAKQHISQLENLERFGTGIREDIFEDEPILYGSIPELDDPQFLALRKNDEELNKGLDEIYEALQVVRQVAEAMNIGIAAQQEIMTNVEDQVDKVQENISTLNTNIKKVIKTARKPRECICNLIICLLILAIILWYVFISTSS